MANHTVVFNKNRTQTSAIEKDTGFVDISKLIMAAALRQGLQFNISTSVVDNGTIQLAYRVSASSHKDAVGVSGVVNSVDDERLLLDLAIIDGAITSRLSPPAIKEAIVEVGEPKQRIGVLIDHWRHFSHEVIDDSISVINKTGDSLKSQKGYWVGYSDIGAELISVPDGTPNTEWAEVGALIYAHSGNAATVVKVAFKEPV